MTATTPRYRSELRAHRDGFAQLLHAEWTKFRTFRGWMIAACASSLVVVLVAWIATRQHSSYYCSTGTGASCQPSTGHPPVPVGPDGEAVTDTYYFVHRTLTGAGSITARVTGLAGVGGQLQPWSKAGLIITDGTRPGSAYAAIMVTGGHGVRMQYDFTHDTAFTGAGATGTPQWLRLTRAGTTLTGYASVDGAHWAKIGTAHLPGLPTSVQAGLFATSPQTTLLIHSAGRLYADSVSQPTNATATFDRLVLQGGWRSGGWRGEYVGANAAALVRGPVGYHRSNRGFTVRGSGDIAPAVSETAGYTAQIPLAGVFAGLIVLIVVATMFITVEYRRGLIRTTLSASPRRGRVLAAKALVMGLVAFLAGAAAAAVAVPVGEHILRSNGNYVYPTDTLTNLRVILGTGALVAVVAVLAVAVGTVLRRSAGAVCAVIVLIVLPYILATASALPSGFSQWLMRVTPAAAFAVQQTLPEYHQVSYPYTPSNGFYPLSPAGGFAVLCAYALVALGVATYLLRTRDA
jgi:hypothetical protein